MILRVVCDTNVLVSALIADGPPSRLIEEAVAGRMELLMPDVVMGELERVLRSKLGFSDRRWDSVRDFLRDLAGERVSAPAEIEPVSGDSADDEVLACAVAAGADVVASGDRQHLLPLGEHRGVRLLTPQALLAELAAGSA